MLRPTSVAAFALLIAAACSAQRAPNTGAERPAEVPFTEDKLKQLKVPAGFEVSVFAKGLGNPRMLAVGDDGTVYVTRRDEGDVLAFRDSKGRGDGQRTIVKLADAHGIFIQANKMYLADVGNVYVADIAKDGGIGPVKKIVDWLPTGGGHHNRTVAIGPDGLLYITVGSTCNVCVDPEDRNAVMLRVKPDGGGREVFARGLRNTIGFGWHPQTNELWGMDHGSDWRGDDFPPEELNRLQQGKHYGWPYCLENRKPDPLFDEKPPRGRNKEEFCAQTEPPVLTTTAHTAPIGFVFYNAAMFPAEFKGDAFAAMRGSWNRRPPAGYKVLRVRFENGKPIKFEDFLTGFQSADGKSVFGRPAGVTVAKDGALLVADDSSGVIYRVAAKR